MKLLRRLLSVAVCALAFPSAALADSPLVSGVSASNVTSTSAVFGGSVNPRGEGTSYHFEYLTQTAFENSGWAAAANVPSGIAGVGNGTSAVSVTQGITSLTPGTSYRVRLVAANASGTAFGTARTFATYVPGITGLPDGRAYEQVTPVDKNGGNAGGEHNLLAAAADGNGMTFMNSTGFPGADGGQTFGSFASLRSEAGWSVSSLLPSAQLGRIVQVLGVSEDLRNTLGVAAPYSGAPEQGLYIRGIGESASTLITQLPRLTTPYLVGSATDAGLAAYEAVHRGGSEPAEVYVWRQDDGSISRGSVLNDGLAPTSGGSFGGSYQGNTETGGVRRGFFAQAAHVFSRDGSRLFFTAAGTGQIYMRSNPSEPQSALSGGVSTAAGAASGKGDLTAGSATVTELLTAETASAVTTAGSRLVTGVKASVGRFGVGQPLEAVPGNIAAGTTIASITEVEPGRLNLTLSENAQQSASGVTLRSHGPAPFAVGQSISGPGIPHGTKVTAASSGTLTLSAVAAASASAATLSGSTECLEPSRACTLQVSASERNLPDPNGERPAAFVGATANGSEAFFLSSSQLTDDATTGAADGGRDLYRYRPDAPPGHRLTDFSVDNQDSNGAQVKGVLGFSEDGNSVYFAAAGQIPGTGAPVAGCTGTDQSVLGLCNLYWARQDPSTGSVSTTYIGQLRGEGSSERGDAPDWTAFGIEQGGAGLVKGARVAANGSTLLFSSVQPLTGYENTGPCVGGSGSKCSELFVYRPATGLSCVSCNPTGAAPLGPASLQDIRTFGVSLGQASRSSRNVSANGMRVFFESPDPLVPADVNGIDSCSVVPFPNSARSCQDVYEWEAVGAGSCSATDPAYSPFAAGCIYLISAGTSPDPSYFGDASESGDDVFIFTSSHLVGQDKDDLVDVYDARVGGGIPSQNPFESTPCEGEVCRSAAVVPPATGTPGSADFSGPGNVPVKKHPKKHKQKKKHGKKHKQKKKHGKQKGQRQGRGR